MINTGDKLFGFSVTRVRESAELRGRMVEMTYDKTGTDLVWIDNGEENKLFSITFRTFPEDSTGVFHILEHSTLCGSRKFPVKEPFVELLKSSMNTFLNAMTFGDKTMYPVSSRNEKDYMNLTQVYLDAVFAPRLLEDPNIFYQEGHHIEFEEDHLIYKGVVFNEMKGAMSGADRVIDQKLDSMLYPDNTYGFNSGGDPECIPDLTYEKFCETYHRFYHPSNARVFLDGDVPLEKVLKLLDEYLCKYEKAESIPQLTPQQPKGSEDTIYFEVAQGEPLENRGRLSMARLDGTEPVDRTRSFAMGVITDVLCGSNEAPLTRAVLESGLAQDISLAYSDESYQAACVMSLINIKDGSEKELTDLIYHTLDSLLQDGLDAEALNASVNRAEFRLREQQEPQGLIRCIMAQSGCWLFGGDPMDGITFDKVIRSVRAMIADGSINTLAKEVLLDRKDQVILHAYPSYTAGDELRAREQKRLKMIRDNMTEEDKEALIALNDTLQQWQQSEDTPEQLATLPTLTLKDVPQEGRYTPTEVREECGVKKLYHPVNCHGLKHVNLYFSVADLSLDQLPPLHFISGIFGTLPTAKYSPLALENRIKNVFGSLNFSAEFGSFHEDRHVCRPVIKVSMSFLDEKLEEAADLLLEILQHTRLDATDRVREMVMQEEEDSKQLGAQRGHIIAISAAGSHYSAASAANEAVNGFTAVRYLHDLAKHFDEKIDAFMTFWGTLMQNTFCRDRLIFSVSGSEDTSLEVLLTRLPKGTPIPEKASYESTLPAAMGLRIPAQISYAIRAYNMKEANIPYAGNMQVAANILTLSHLWNRIRVQGGAYGCGQRTNPEGFLACYSYRDPTPARSLEVYKEMGGFLRDFAAHADTLDNFIISTVSDTDPLIGPRDQGNRADSIYLSGITRDEMKANRKSMLACSKEDLIRFADAIDQMNEHGCVCVAGHDAALKECGELTVFDL